MDEPESTEAPPAEADLNRAKGALQAIRELLETLEPSATIRIEDAYGGVYTLRSAVPARAQIRAMRALESVSSLAGGEDLQAFAAASRGGVQAALTMLIRAAANEQVLDGLCAAFGHAYPDAVRAASVASGVKATEVADLFPVEEVVAGLVPFCIRLVRRLLGLVTKADR
jgi:hypothetical protein